MAGFDIHTVEARLPGKLRALHQGIPHPVQVIVGDDPVGRDGGVLFKDGIVVGDQRGGGALGLGIAAGMGGLHDDQGRVAVCLQGGFPDGVCLAAEGIQIVLGDEQLAGIGLAFFHNGSGFKPNQTGTALGKTVIAPLGQLAWGAVGIAVAALHGLAGKTVGDGGTAKCQGGGKGSGAFQVGKVGRKRGVLTMEGFSG